MEHCHAEIFRVNYGPQIAQLVKNLPAMQETPVRFLGREDLLEKGWATLSSILGLPCGSSGNESTCNVGDLGWEDPLEKGKATLPTPVFWPGEFHGLYSPWGHKESDMTERLSLMDPRLLLSFKCQVPPHLPVCTEVCFFHCESPLTNVVHWFFLTCVRCEKVGNCNEEHECWVQYLEFRS